MQGALHSGTSREAGVLRVKAPPAIVLQLRPERGKDMTWLVKKGPGISLSFERDESGKIIGMPRHIGGERRAMTRRA